VRNRGLCLVALGVLVFRPCDDGRGQYIDRDDRPAGSISRFLSAGVFRRDFSPTGGNTAPDSLRIRYGRLMPAIAFRQSGFEITLAYGTHQLNGKRAEMVILSSTYMNDFPIGMSRAVAASLIIGADYAKAGSGGSVRDDFNLASVGLGFGLVSGVDIGRMKLVMSAHALIHLSYEAYSTRTASSPAVLGSATLSIPGVPLGDGLALGYRFRWQRWSTGGYFDYRAVNHGLLLGVLL
jgi:hypothetical protein